MSCACLPAYLLACLLARQVSLAVESLQLRSVRPDTAASAATSGGSANDTVTSSTRGDVIAVTSSSCLAAESLQLRSVRPDTAASAATSGGSTNDTVTSSTRGDVIAVTSSSCLPEFARVGAWPSCYRFSTFNATWHEAREYCSAFGANLLALDSLKEAHIIDYLLNSKPGHARLL